MKLGHVHLKVSDLEEAVDFYRTVFGFDVEEESGKYVFLSSGSEHHVVALQEIDDPSSPARNQPGLYHLAFEVGSEEELRAIADRARPVTKWVTPVDHGISRSIYFEDPSGNGIEVYVDTREQRDREEWDGENTSFSLD